MDDKSGKTTGEEDDYVSTAFTEGELRGSKDLTSPHKIFVWPKPILLQGPDWVTTIRDLQLELEEIGDYSFTTLLHCEFSSPVGYDKAYHHPDINLVFNAFAQSGASVWAFPHHHYRGCGSYVYEPKMFKMSGGVVRPIQNTWKIVLNGSFATRVTWC